MFSNSGEKSRREGDRAFAAKNYPAALRAYEKAAGEGNAEAMFKLGQMIDNGQAEARDPALVEYWYEKARDAGYRSPEGKLQILTMNDFYRTLDKAEEDYASMRKAMELHRQDLHAESAQYFKQAAEQGCVHAMSYLADNYYFGLGVEEDVDKTFYWLNKAVSMGNLFARETIEEYKEELEMMGE